MRKGIFDMVMTLYVLIGLIIILVGYGLLLMFVGNVTSFNQDQVIRADKMNHASLALMNLLKTPVEVDLDKDNNVETIDMIDLIAVYQDRLDKYLELGGGVTKVDEAGLTEIRAEVKGEVTKILDNVYDGKWNLNIVYDIENDIGIYSEIEATNAEHKFIYLEDRPKAIFNFPGLNGKMINITFISEYDIWFVGGIGNE